MVSQSNSFFSPKSVAKALGVSESSLKRWCDRGRIRSMKTAGGHRRLTHADVIDFVRHQKISLQNPEAIGLPSIDSHSIETTADAQKQLYDVLISGNESGCRDLLVYLFVNLWPVEMIVDDVIAPAFDRIGRGWESGLIDVYQERRGCEVCSSALRAIRSMLPEVRERAPKAIGGSIEQDPYALPTLAVEVTLAANGWNARSFGSNIPFQSFREAVSAERPNLVWMSISHIQDEERVQQGLNQFAANLPPSVTLVIGGNAISPTLRNGLKSVVCCDNMSQLLAFSKNLVAKGSVSF